MHKFVEFYSVKMTLSSTIHCIMAIDVVFEWLGETVDVRSGYPFRGPIDVVEAGSVLVVQMKDVDVNDGVRWPGAVRTELRNRKPTDWLQSGDILFVARGGRFYATCISTPPDAAVCGPHLLHLRVHSGSGIEPAFLAWQINQPPVQKQLRAAAEGTSQLSVRITEIEALRIAVPPIEKQLQIVGLANGAAKERQLLTQLILNREKEIAAIAACLANKGGLDQN